MTSLRYKRQSPTSKRISNFNRFWERPRVLDAYAKAGADAIRTSFDGIEFHSTNGNFIDRLVQNFISTRTDEYRGYGEGRARFRL